MKENGRLVTAISLLLTIGVWLAPARPARADGNIKKVKHIIVMMQENHSFDNYLGVLPYVGGPYHPPVGQSCAASDHKCVDGLSCRVDAHNNLQCMNNNIDDDGSTVRSFHETKFCTGPDLDHEWPGSHREANLNHPTETILSSPNDGFVVQNDTTEQIDNGVESPTDDDTMGYYNQDDLPFYYKLAQTFSMDDRYFSSLLGPTFSNRCYSYAATSFGHLDAHESVVLPGYKPITGTILDLLDEHHVKWANYYSDVPVSFSFRTLSPNALPIQNFVEDAKRGKLPEVSFVDPNFGILSAAKSTDEHPPANIRAGEFFISQMVSAVRNGPDWKDSVIFITYDEAGGFYDHVAPPRVQQGGKPNPDGINPGQCADLSAPPESEAPGEGANCELSQGRAKSLCPSFTPTGPYPSNCPNFDQYGFRVPFIAVSPFSKPQYVSHTVGDHTPILAFIEKRFFNGKHTHLTLRDQNASTLEDMFDFKNAPSLNAAIPQGKAPGKDPGCPFPKPPKIDFP
jgi:phospholipase C